MRSPPSRWIRVKVGSSGYPRNFKFNVLDSNGIQNDFLLSSLVDEHARVVRIEIHVAYVTFSSPVLPAGLFGNTFFMNIPDMFCDLLELPLCRSTQNEEFESRNIESMILKSCNYILFHLIFSRLLAMLCVFFFNL